MLKTPPTPRSFRDSRQRHVPLFRMRRECNRLSGGAARRRDNGTARARRRVVCVSNVNRHKHCCPERGKCPHHSGGTRGKGRRRAAGARQASRGQPPLFDLFPGCWCCCHPPRALDIVPSPFPPSPGALRPGTQTHPTHDSVTDQAPEPACKPAASQPGATTSHQV